MSKSKDYIKKKASEFISLVSGLAEKKIHTIVELGAEQLSVIEKGIQDAYHTVVDNLEDWTNRFREKEPGEFTNGDLAISPVDIVYQTKIFSVNKNGDTTKQSETKTIKAGEVFEFKEELIPYLKTPLFEADTKAAIEWARLDELNQLNYLIQGESWRVALSDPQRIKEYIKLRQEQIKRTNQPEPEKV